MLQIILFGKRDRLEITSKIEMDLKFVEILQNSKVEKV
jgi:hypothetical protein